MYLLNGLVLAMDDEMEDETGRLNLPARFSGLAVDSANEAPPLESRYSWAMEYEVGVTDQEDAERDRAKVRELQRISPVYWAAKTMLCSSQMKEHVRNTPELSRVLGRPTGKCTKEDLAPLQDLNKDSVIIIE
jgi:hypothetical protein